jgi:hypothetical protein
MQAIDVSTTALAAEIAVFGAGAAGSAAALAAARAGAKVYLFESDSTPGGAVAHCLIHTLGGLYDSAGGLMHDGLVSELVERLAREDPAIRRRQMGRTWVLNVNPEGYQFVLGRWLAAERRVTLIRQAHIVALKMRGGSVIEIQVDWPGNSACIHPQVVVDATGTAEVVARIDQSLLHRAAPTAAGGLIIRLRGVAQNALKFPNNLAMVKLLRTAVQEGELPQECANAWLDSGVYDDEAYLKMAVRLPEDWKARKKLIVDTAKLSGACLVAFLKRRAEFNGAWVDRIGSLGVREGGRIRGEYCLTREDVQVGRRFYDAACRCSWPIEFWHPEQGVSLEYLSPGSWYEIPFRALKVDGLENVWAVGKCLSADAYAQASARIAGCCWAMGQAVGQLVGQGVTA